MLDRKRQKLNLSELVALANIQAQSKCKKAQNNVRLKSARKEK